MAFPGHAGRTAFPGHACRWVAASCRPYAGGAMDPSRPDRRRIGPAVTVVAVGLAGLAMSGCFTGERPTLAHDVTTGSPAVDAVVERVGRIGEAVYTADYEAYTEYTGVTTAVRASQSGTGTRSLTIGDVRYLVDGSDTRTCTVSTGDCVEEIDAARVSDVQMTPDFFGTSLSARIRRDAEIAVAAPTASTEDVGGQQATCAAIPVDGATNTYCVFDNGVLARLDAADVDMTLTAYEPGADAALFTPDGT